MIKKPTLGSTSLFLPQSKPHRHIHNIHDTLNGIFGFYCILLQKYKLWYFDKIVKAADNIITCFFYFYFYFLRGIHSVVGSNLCERKWKSFHPIYNKVLLIEHVYNYRHEHILLLGVQQVLMVMAFIKAYMKRTSKENATRRRRQKKKIELLMKVLGKVLCE